MGILQMITEDTEITYSNESELSYFDDGDVTVSVYVNREFVGDARIYKDAEMDGREYIILNNTIIYLDVIERK
jgi:hypothetical protein